MRVRGPLGVFVCALGEPGVKLTARKNGSPRSVPGRSQLKFGAWLSFHPRGFLTQLDPNRLGQNVFDGGAENSTIKTHGLTVASEGCY